MICFQKACMTCQFLTIYCYFLEQSDANIEGEVFGNCDAVLCQHCKTGWVTVVRLCSKSMQQHDPLARRVGAGKHAKTGPRSHHVTLLTSFTCVHLPFRSICRHSIIYYRSVSWWLILPDLSAQKNPPHLCFITHYPTFVAMMMTMMTALMMIFWLGLARATNRHICFESHFSWMGDQIKWVRADVSRCWNSRHRAQICSS